MNAQSHFSTAIEADKPFEFDADLYEDLARAGAFDKAGRIELIEGVIFELSPQAIPHMRAKSEIVFRLRDALRLSAPSLRVDFEGSVRISRTSVPEPDIIVWDGVAQTGFVGGDAVSFLVEVADTTLARDLVCKARLYAAAKVPEYWVVDVNGGIVHRFSNSDGENYQDRAVFRCGERIESATVSGVAIDLPVFP